MLLPIPSWAGTFQATNRMLSWWPSDHCLSVLEPHTSTRLSQAKPASQVGSDKKVKDGMTMYTQHPLGWLEEGEDKNEIGGQCNNFKICN